MDNSPATSILIALVAAAAIEAAREAVARSVYAIAFTRGLMAVKGFAFTRREVIQSLLFAFADAPGVHSAAFKTRRGCDTSLWVYSDHRLMLVWRGVFDYWHAAMRKPAPRG